MTTQISNNLSPEMIVLKETLQKIGNGAITYDDYKEMFNYREIIGTETISVYASYGKVFTTREFNYDVRIYDAEEQKSHVSTHYFANSDITFVGNQNTMRVCENHLHTNDKDFISNFVNSKF